MSGVSTTGHQELVGGRAADLVSGSYLSLNGDESYLEVRDFKVSLNFGEILIWSLKRLVLVICEMCQEHFRIFQLT